MNYLSSRDLWLMRLWYFFRFGGLGFYFPFISIFYHQRGLNGTQIGWLATIASITAVLLAPLWGHWSDRKRGILGLLQLALLGSGTAMLLISLQSHFAFMAIFVAMESLSSAGIEPLSNLQTLAVLNSSRRTDFGNIRLWGSLGYAITAPFCGWLSEKYGLITIFIAYGLANLANILLLQLLKQRTASVKPSDTISPTPSLKEVIVRQTKSPIMIGLALAFIVNTFGISGILRFEWLFLKQLNARYTLVGAASSLQAIIEMPVMYMGDKLRNRIGSLNILLLGFVFRAISTLPVLIYPAVISVYIYRVLTASGFALAMVGMVPFIAERTTDLERSTVMAFYSVTLSSLTMMIASPINGLIFDRVGPYWLYVITLFCSTIACILIWITSRKNKN